MTYEDVHAWYKVSSLIANRVHVINMTIGIDVCNVRYEKGSYYVDLCECSLTSYKVYDLPSVERAFACIDAVSDAVWYMSRAGMFTRNQRTMGKYPLCNERLSAFV